MLLYVHLVSLTSHYTTVSANNSIIHNTDNTGADPGFCQGGWLAGPKKFSRHAAPRKNFGALLGVSGGMLPQEIFKIETARLA